MSALALIRQCRDAGIQLQARGDRLHVKAPAGSVTPELRQALTDHKAELLTLHAISSPAAFAGRHDGHTPQRGRQPAG